MENKEFDQLFQAKLGGAQELPFDPAAWEAVAPSVEALNKGGGGWSSGALAALFSALLVAVVVPWLVVEPSGQLASHSIAEGNQQWIDEISTTASNATALVGFEEQETSTNVSNALPQKSTATDKDNSSTPVKAAPNLANATTSSAENKTTPATTARREGNTALSSSIIEPTNSKILSTSKDDELFQRLNHGLLASNSDQITPPNGEDGDLNYLHLMGVNAATPEFSPANRTFIGPDEARRRFAPASIHLVFGPALTRGLINTGDPLRGSNGYGGFGGVQANWSLSSSFSFNAGVAASIRNGLNSVEEYRSAPDANDNRFDSARVASQWLTSIDIPLYFQYAFGWSPQLAYRNQIGVGMEYSIPVFRTTETTTPDSEKTDWLGRPEGFNPNLALRIHYQYALNERLRLGMRASFGMFDMTDDSHFGYSVVDRNSQLRLLVNYKLGRLSAH
ncbi:MAG: hypothetical protein ACFB10_06940 [Salibacteraceae bacterium]